MFPLILERLRNKLLDILLAPGTTASLTLFLGDTIFRGAPGTTASLTLFSGGEAREVPMVGFGWCFAIG
jgi:hypothetical protein